MLASKVRCVWSADLDVRFRQGIPQIKVCLRASWSNWERAFATRRKRKKGQSDIRGGWTEKLGMNQLCSRLCCHWWEDLKRTMPNTKPKPSALSTARRNPQLIVPKVFLKSRFKKINRGAIFSWNTLQRFGLQLGPLYTCSTEICRKQATSGNFSSIKWWQCKFPIFWTFYHSWAHFTLFETPPSIGKNLTEGSASLTGWLSH